MKEPPKNRAILVWTRDWADQITVQTATFMGSHRAGYWCGDSHVASRRLLSLEDILGWSEVPDEPQHARALEEGR